MKAVMISYNQVHTERVMAAMDKVHARGLTKWELTQGRGSEFGEPHYGSHAWPSMNSTILSIMDDGKVEKLMELLREIDEESPEQGLKAYYWNVEGGM